MSGINDDFLNALCEHVYGDEYNIHDKRNILRNIKPAYEGTGILKFGTIKNSEYFMEFVIEQWQQKQDLYEQRRRYRKDLKTDKDYKFVCELLQKEKDECENRILEIKEECNEIERGAVENSSIYYQLLVDCKKRDDIIKEQQKHIECQDKLKEQIESITIEKAELDIKLTTYYKEKYKKDKKELDKKESELNTEKEKEIEKFKKEYVRQDDKICNMELKNEIKLLKEELKKVKNQNTKFKKQILESMD